MELKFQKKKKCLRQNGAHFENGHHFADYIFKFILLFEKMLIQISLKLFPMVLINDNPLYVRTPAGTQILTHYGLMTPYGDIDQGQQWLR